MVKSILLILGGIVVGYFGTLLTFYVMDRRDTKRYTKKENRDF